MGGPGRTMLGRRISANVWSTTSPVAIAILVVAGCGSAAASATPSTGAGGPRSPSAAPTASVPAAGLASPSIAPVSASPDALALLRQPIDQLGRRLVATIDVGGVPEWVGAGTDAIWVTNRALGSVQRIDPTRNAIVGSVPVAEPCNGFAFGFGSVWTASCHDQALVRIDPTRNVLAKTIPTAIAADGEGQVAAAFGSIWIAGGDGRLRRLDPASNRFVASLAVPMGADAIVAGRDSIWITDPEGNDVLRIDPAANKVSWRVKVGPHPQFIAADSTAVWVLNQDDGTVSRIDAAAGSVRSIGADSKGRDVGCIGAGLGSSWVTVPDLPLTRVDATSMSVTEQFSGPGGDCLTTGFGSVWLVNNALGTVSRIAPPK